MSLKKSGSLALLLLVASMVFAACGPTPEPQVVEKMVTQVVKETVIVAGTPEVVEKEVTVVTEVTAVPETSSEETKDGGILRYGMYGDPQNWTPYNVISCQNEVIMAQIWSGLLRYNGSSELVGDVAESWEWLDDTTIVFNLRENVKWHNGDHLIADHVVKSMELRMDPDISLDAEGLNEFIDKWEAVDDHTVKLTLKQPNSAILRNLTPVPGHGFILHPNWDEATSGQSAETTIGTGPFMYESYEPGVSVKLVRNPNYFIEGMPYMDGIEFRIIEDAEARLTGIRAGELDMVEYIDFQSLPMLREDPNIYIPTGLGFYGSRLLLDPTVAPTDDVKVRHALNYAVDREMIVDAVLAGEGAPIWGSMIPEGRFGYAPELADYYSYDPAKAIELLAEAGWTDTDGDGTLDKDGQPIKLVFVTYGPSWWSQTGEIVQANLKAIGVETELEVLPWADYKEKRQANIDLPEGEPGTMNVIGSTIWGLDLVDYVNYVDGIYNFNRYDNPDVQALISEALATADDAEREEIYREAQALVMEDAPWIAPVWVSRGEAVRNNVKDFEHLNETACYGTLLWEAQLDGE